jgi:two-component system chemotaxis sensor kinase CheA
MSDSSEFVAEAQELIDGYSQQLLALDAQLRDAGEPDPDLLNGAFRALHTLKSLAGMVGHKPLGDFSHELESTLDRMRLGKLTLDLRGRSAVRVGRALREVARHRCVDRYRVVLTALGQAD